MEQKLEAQLDRVWTDHPAEADKAASVLSATTPVNSSIFSTIPLHSLQHLRLNFYDDAGSFGYPNGIAEALLELIRPTFRHFSFQSHHSNYSRELENVFSQRQFPLLSHCYLDHVLTPSGMVSLRRASPNLHHLHLPYLEDDDFSSFPPSLQQITHISAFWDGQSKPALFNNLDGFPDAKLITVFYGSDIGNNHANLSSWTMEALEARDVEVTFLPLSDSDWNGLWKF